MREGDREIQQLVIERDSDMMQYLGDPVLNDKEFVLYAIRAQGRQLVLRNRILESGGALSPLEKDQGMAFTGMDGKPRRDRKPPPAPRSVLAWVSAALQNDFEVVRAACDVDPTAYQYASRAVRSSKGFAEPLFRREGCGVLLRCCTAGPRRDRAIVFQAMQTDGRRGREAAKSSLLELEETEELLEILDGGGRAEWEGEEELEEGVTEAGEMQE